MLYNIIIPWAVHFSTYWITCAYLMRNYTGFLSEKTVIRNLENTTINFWLFSYFWSLCFPMSIEFTPISDFFKIPFILLFYEVLFFYIHRGFHGKLLMPFHNLHHEWKENIIPLAALDSHKIEYMFLNLFPAFFVFYILGVSYWGSVLFSGIAIANAAMAHQSSNYHLTHHKEKYKHFGIFGIMDSYYNLL